MILRLVSIVVVVVFAIFAYRYFQQYGMHLDAASIKASASQTMDWISHGTGSVAQKKT